MPDEPQPLPAEVRARELRVACLSATAWLTTLGLALALLSAPLPDEPLLTAGLLAIVAAVGVNVGSFATYLVRLGHARRVRSKGEPTR